MRQYTEEESTLLATFNGGGSIVDVGLLVVYTDTRASRLKERILS